MRALGLLGCIAITVISAGASRKGLARHRRTEQYEKLYELYLPKIARKRFPAKNGREFAEWARKSGAFSETWVEFKPESITEMESKL